MGHDQCTALIRDTTPEATAWASGAQICPEGNGGGARAMPPSEVI